jgi:hypothetical protein
VSDSAKLALIVAASLAVGFVAFPVITYWAIKRDERQTSEPQLHDYGIGSDGRPEIHTQRGA